MAIGPDDLHLTDEQERQLRDRARQTGRSESDIIAAALEEYFSSHQESGQAGGSCYEVAQRIGLIGVSGDLPSDLSANPVYFEGFGRE